MLFRSLWCLILLSFASAAVADDESAASLLAHAKVMSGGPLWDRVVALNGQGQIHAADLQGNLESHEDLLRGRQVTRYKLGALQGASGYDGKAAWQQDPGGEVGVLDDAQALREARTAAWLTARAYWFPARGGATYGAVEQREIRSRHFRVVTATPTDGEPVELWFNERSGLIDRFVTRIGGKDSQSTRLSEWKTIDGLRLPTSVLIERGDDARARVFIHYARYAPGGALADTEFAAPAISERTHIADPSGSVRVPFTLVRDHIHVDAKVDGKAVRMLVDTGGMNILLPKSAQRLGLASAGKLEGRGVGEKSTDVAMAPAASLQLGGVSIDRPVFYVIDFGQLPDVEGEDFDGVIGYELFQRLGVTIDYAAHELLLTAADKFTPPAKSQAIPFTLSERIPIVQGRIDGMPARLSVDTGSGSAIDLHSPFVKRQDLKTRYEAKFEQVSGWGVGGPMRAWPVRLGQLQVGDFTLGDVAASLFTGDKGSFAGDDVDANLGGRALSRFTVGFDYKRKLMYLAPNARYGEPFASDRSGLVLLRDGAAISVYEVLADGPAAAAGLQAGDRLSAIDRVAVSAHTLSEWRELLARTDAGKTLAIDYQRGGKKRSARLVLKDLIPQHGPAH